MNTLLIRNAHRLVAMDGSPDAIGTELADGAIFARNGWIERVGPTSKLPTHAHRVIDARGKVVLPGFVNTHHHLYQTMTRAVFGAESTGLFDWLKTLYPIWNRMTPDHVRVATTLGLAELALTGCTTAFDHQYMWPKGSSIDDQFEGAKHVGLRFHASRGSMSVGESSGGLPPDSAVEEEGAILRACEDAIEDHHDPRPGSMRQVAIAPCSPFSVSTKLMTASAEMARRLNVRLHTHLAETVDEEAYCLEQFGARPVEYAESVGWLGDDVWFAHGVHVAADEISELARTGTGVAHCPTSNMRLASGLAPLLSYLEAGVPVGLGVDGSASNDSSNMLAEARMAMLCARLSTAPGIGEPADQLSARSALWLATRGGARLLGRTDVGSIEVGKACDVILVDIGDIEHSGFADPVAAVVLGSARRIHTSIVHGNVVVENQRLVNIDERELVMAHRNFSNSLLS